MSASADVLNAELLDGEFEVEAQGELLWRLVSPAHVKPDGFVAGDAFYDAARQTSVVRSSVRSAAEAYDHHLLAPDRRCAGAWGILVGEVHGIPVADGETVSCRVVDDSARDEVTVPGHSYVDMRGISGIAGFSAKRIRKIVRNTIAAAASERGCQHP